MSLLRKEQKEKLETIVKDEQLFVRINELLKELGAADLQLMSLRVQPKRDLSLNSQNYTLRKVNEGKPNYGVYPPLCKHGMPMIQVCTIGGSCRWVCSH